MRLQVKLVIRVLLLLPPHSHTIYPVPHFWNSRSAFEVHFTMMQHTTEIHPYRLSRVYGQLIHIFSLKIFNCERRPSYNWINTGTTTMQFIQTKRHWDSFCSEQYTLPPSNHGYFLVYFNTHVSKAQFLLGASPLTQPCDGKSRNLLLVPRVCVFVFVQVSVYDRLTYKCLHIFFCLWIYIFKQLQISRVLCNSDLQFPWSWRCRTWSGFWHHLDC
jgi:hypothetical protein